MNARIRRSYDQLPPSEQQKIYSAVYADVAHKAAKMITAMADEVASIRTCIAIDCGLYAGMLSAIDKLGVGTDSSRLAGRESRLQRFADGYMEFLGAAGERYDEYLLEGLRYQLRARGVEVPELEPHRKTKSIEELETVIRESLEKEKKQ